MEDTPQLRGHITRLRHQLEQAIATQHAVALTRLSGQPIIADPYQLTEHEGRTTIVFWNAGRHWSDTGRLDEWALSTLREVVDLGRSFETIVAESVQEED